MKDILKEITKNHRWHPNPSAVSKEKLMDNAGYDEVFMDDKWAVVEVRDTNMPWIVHYCYASDYGGTTWNYVYSSQIAMDYEPPKNHFRCSECKVKAPDNIITVLELYK